MDQPVRSLAHTDSTFQKLTDFASHDSHYIQLGYQRRSRGDSGYLMTQWLIEPSISFSEQLLAPSPLWLVSLSSPPWETVKPRLTLAKPHSDTAVVSLILCYLINWIPGMHFRVSTDSEIVGMDESECGEYAYDFVSIRNEIHPGAAGGDDGHMTAYGSTRAGSLVEPEHEKVPAGGVGAAQAAAPVPSPPASTSAASGMKA